MHAGLLLVVEVGVVNVAVARDYGASTFTTAFIASDWNMEI